MYYKSTYAVEYKFYTLKFAFHKLGCGKLSVHNWCRNIVYLRNIELLAYKNLSFRLFFFF